MMNGISESIPFYLALHRAPRLGPKKARALLDYFQNIKAIFSADRITLKNFALSGETISYLRSPDWKKIEIDLKWLSEPEHHLLTIHDPDYPELLKHISVPPFLIFVDGDKTVLKNPQISIVGSRRPTTTGKRNAKEFAGLLAKSGFTITSGLALGIDKESHQGALEASGKTIAVLGNGIDNIYPVKHVALANQIKENGAVISEFPPLTPPLPQNFPQRNRIISGLGLGTLVVEAAKKSGSLITAQFALEQGREVFAIPGSILNPMSSGCHRLLKQGAKMVESIEDIFEELKYQFSIQNNTLQLENSTVEATTILTKKYLSLLEMVGFDPISIDELVTQSRLTADEVSSMLLTLELDGYIQSQLGGSYIRITKT